MRRIISVIGLVTASIFAMLFVSPAAYAADSSCDSYVFAIPAWYNGLMGRSSGSCQFEAEKMGGAEKDKPDVVRTAGKIGSNIVQALMVIAAYVAVFFLIKGGFTYIYSAGSAENISNAKKTIQNALIGLVIAVMAASIVNAIGAAI
jgi:hypothetical protein